MAIEEQEHDEQERQEDVTDDGQDNKTSKRKRKRKRKKKSDENDEDDDRPADEASAPATTTPEDDAKAQEVDRTIFVEGIPFTCTPDQVREFFTTHVTDASIVDLRLPVWHDSGRLRGYGHVVFATTAQRDAALQLTGKYLQKRYLTIQKAQAPKGSGGAAAATTVAVDHSQPSATVSLHNLSYQATEDDIAKVMKQYGAIPDGGVRIVRHSHTGRSKGFAYVSYDAVDAATRAVKAAPVLIAGRPCRLDYDHGRVRGSFRTADRKLWHKEYNSNKKSKAEQDE